MVVAITVEVKGCYCIKCARKNMQSTLAQMEHDYKS